MEKRDTYTISIPIELYKDLRNLANAQQRDIDEVLRSAIRWQFILAGIQKEEGELFVKYKGSSSINPINFGET